MGNKRFSMTTYVLVGISLVALYFVGKTVTPPPAAPTPEVTAASSKSPTAPSPAQSKLDAKKEMEANKERAKHYEQMAKSKKNPAVDPKAFNPQAIDATAGYWHDPKVTEGSKGEQIMAERVKEATAKMPKPPTAPVTQKATKMDPPH